jgi:glycosyltransferase involved in cell wall biosynthesis
MENTTPVISIGLPVYNEEKFIASTIESILAQTYVHFELIISDNSSTDKTSFICQDYVTQDPRVKHFQQETNVGAVANAQYVVNIANGHYFVWVSGHDIWHPEFLEKSLNVMEKDEEVVLCHPQGVWIDVDNNEIGNIGRPIETRGLNRLERFQIALWGMGYGSTIYGLIRTKALKECSLGLKVIGPDNIFLCELSLLGSFAHIPEPLQYIRRLDDYGSWEHYVQKIFNQKLSEFSGVELFGQMLTAYIDVTVKHVNSKPEPELDIMLMSIVNCLFTKYNWIFNALAKNNQEDFISGEHWFKFLALLQKVSSQASSDIFQIYQDNKKIDVRVSPIILIDAVFFQYYLTGIARVWTSLLELWSKTQLSQHILVLDRAGTAPKIPGIRYRTIPAYSYDNTEADRTMLQQVCNEERVDIFISTYYTIPESTPSVFMAYDMIPEILEINLQKPEWQEKHRAIQYASSFISISDNTAQDLKKIFPALVSQPVIIAHCGVSEKLSTASPREVNSFTTKYGIRKPYFLLVGMGFFCVSNHYKNGELFFNAFAQLPDTENFDIVCTGGTSLDPKFRQYTSGSSVHLLNVTDEELRLAYAGAIALVFPSQYEGFGMPIAEAMACGCPVITCKNSAIPEVAGDAVLYVDELNIPQMTDALLEVQKPHVRKRLIQAGLQQAQKFTWQSMADKVGTALLEATLIPLKLREINYIVCPDWSQPEELIVVDLENALRMGMAGSHPERTTLLICLDDADPEAADLILSSAAMSLMMNTDLDISEGLEVSLVSQLSNLQWQILLPHLKNRLKLKQENQPLIAKWLKNLSFLEI